MDDMHRYYEILGLTPDAPIEARKQAYKDLVKVWHPDRFAHDPRLQQKAQEKLQEINEAYETVHSFLTGCSTHSSFSLLMIFKVTSSFSVFSSCLPP